MLIEINETSIQYHCGTFINAISQTNLLVLKNNLL